MLATGGTLYAQKWLGHCQQGKDHTVPTGCTEVQSMAQATLCPESLCHAPVSVGSDCPPESALPLFSYDMWETCFFVLACSFCTLTSDECKIIISFWLN